MVFDLLVSYFPNKRRWQRGPSMLWFNSMPAIFASFPFPLFHCSHKLAWKKCFTKLRPHPQPPPKQGTCVMSGCNKPGCRDLAFHESDDCHHARAQTRDVPFRVYHGLDQIRKNPTRLDSRVLDAADDIAVRQPKLSSKQGSRRACETCKQPWTGLGNRWNHCCFWPGGTNP